MKFHLNHTPEKFGFEISHQDPCFLIGSCFAENISRKMQEQGFSIFSNPNGIVFNPISLAHSLRAIIEGSALDERFLIEQDGLWYSFLHHSSVHASNIKELQQKISATQNTAGEFLKNSRYLIITFGSAFVYQHKALQHVVSNCHKQPATLFEKTFLEPETIVETYQSLIQKLKDFNPDLKIIFTVSPVKYLKDGLENNSHSKASLLLAVNRLVKVNPNCYYFPAFELQNDDLRDYRFYKEDLAHPNAQAIDYIWEKFAASAFSEKTIHIISEISKLNAALQHRKLYNAPEGEKKLQTYIDQQKEKIRTLLPDFETS
jgi:hypothetical protein